MVDVYDAGGALSEENQGIIQEGKSGSNVEHYHRGGTYYLQIESTCSWSITVKNAP
jgi:hypothetical protein